ncbi:hypothetical protein F4779DRAFT_634516 [Xylariaceae sp. FL0662B]|nr:hypothetical protein F4779DRAFT_634516 [Xylariaceae sp. FL0662B]
MFTTFSSTQPASGAAAGAGAGAAAGADDPSPKTTTPSRPRRSQVRRACDWCKLMRIRCEGRRPCSNCCKADRECSTSGDTQCRSIADVVAEVKRLREKLGNFEAGRPSSSLASRHGVRIDSVFYGITSLPFYLTRMSKFIRTSRNTLQQPDLVLELGARGLFCPLQQSETGFLPKDQETYFLDLFWQTYYFSYPILNEIDLRRQFRSLWADCHIGASRASSPLLDIVLALCIQLGSSLIHEQRPASDHNSSNDTDRNHGSNSSCQGSVVNSSNSTLPGFQYYRRCEEALDHAIESPSITTVQCYIFSIVYLYQAGLFNRAQVVAAKVIMMALMLGVPSELPSSEPEPIREIARRTWWSLYILDAKLAVEAGRPLMVSAIPSNCHLPSDSDEVAKWLSPHYSHDTSCATWLGYQTQTLRLLDTVTTIANVLHAKYDVVVGQGGYEDFVTNASAREQCACVLSKYMENLIAWAKQVPASYAVPRRASGQPFSTDRSPIDFSPNILIHCQRQRLLLELSYHHYCISLYQPFVRLVTTSDSPTPVSDSIASAALNHALAFTSMAHQALTSSEALNGVHNILRWQTNALFTIFGYAYTFPICGMSASIRSSMDVGIAVIDMYRETQPEAGPISVMARTIADDVGSVVTGFNTGKTSWPSSSSTALPMLGTEPPTDGVQGSQPSAAPAATPAAGTASSAETAEVSDKEDFTPMILDNQLLDLSFLHDMATDGGRTAMERMAELWASLNPNGEGFSDAYQWESL